MFIKRGFIRATCFCLLYFVVVTVSAVGLSRLNDQVKFTNSTCSNSLLCPSSNLIAVEQAMLKIA